MNTNRTTLNQAIQEGGYTNYNNYINKMRIDDFISIVKTSEPQLTYKEIFHTVGYTSKASAMRNFKLYTGMIPSEYFVQFKIYEEYERERKN